MSSASLEIRAEPEVVQNEEVLRAQPARGLTHRAYLNAFSTLLDQLMNAAVLSLVTPILVASLGKSLFGVWQVLSRMVLYMQAADGRPTQALKWLIANQQALDNEEEKRRHIGSALGVWLLFLPVLIAIGLFLVWVSPIVTKVPEEMYWVVRVACALMVLNFMLMNLAALPESVLRGMNLGYKRMGLQASLNVVGGVLTIVAVRMGSGLVGVAAAQVVLAVLTGALFITVVKKYVPWFGFARPSMKEVRSFLRLSIWWFAWTLINKLLMTSDIIILGIIVSTSAVTTYALTGFASTTLLSFVTLVLGSVTPGLGGVIGLKQYEKALALRREMMAVSWFLLACIGSNILLWNRSFVFLWVGGDNYAGFWSNLLIILMIVQLIFIRNDAYVIDLTLQLRDKVIRGAVAAVLSIILSILLTPRLGIVGLCLGVMGGRLVLTVSYPFIVNSCLGRERKLSLNGLVRPGITMALMFGACAYLGQKILVHNWIEWVIYASASFALTLAVAPLMGLEADLRDSLVKRLKMLRTLYAAR